MSSGVTINELADSIQVGADDKFLPICLAAAISEVETIAGGTPLFPKRIEQVYSYYGEAGFVLPIRPVLHLESAQYLSSGGWNDFDLTAGVTIDGHHRICFDLNLPAIQYGPASIKVVADIGLGIAVSISEADTITTKDTYLKAGQKVRLVSTAGQLPESIREKDLIVSTTNGKSFKVKDKAGADKDVKFPSTTGAFYIVDIPDNIRRLVLALGTSFYEQREAFSDKQSFEVGYGLRDSIHNSIGGLNYA